MIQLIQEWLLYKKGVNLTRQQIILGVVLTCLSFVAIIILVGNGAQHKRNIAPDGYVPAEYGL